MANKIWVGTDSGNEGDWGTAANWTPSGVPVSTDDVFFASGSQSVTGTLDQSAVTLDSLRIGNAYTGSIASSGAYLQINATVLDFTSGGQECWIDGAIPTVTVLGGVSSPNMLQLKGDPDTLRILSGSGTVTLASTGTTLDELEVFGADSISVVVPNGVTSLDNVQVDSGNISIGASVSTLVTLIGGTLKVTDSATAVTINQNGGTCDYQSSGTITTLNLFAGTFTVQNNVATSLTISNATMHEGSILDLRNGLDNMTMTAGVIQHGGVYFPPHGKLITFS
jgi:hypothetical protein